MNVALLIDAVVRQTMVLIAELATSGGLRAPLAHLANQVFIELASELHAQGLSRKVGADMFGMALYDSESHFLCARDSDCTSLGSDARCVVRHCVSSSAPGSSSTSTAMSEGAGAADASGGSAATATRPDGGSSVPPSPQDAGPPPPSPLIGLETDGASLSLVRVDPRTGLVTFQVPRSETPYMQQGISAFEEKSQRWFVIAGATSTDASLLALDANTGAILRQTPISGTIAGIGLSPIGFAALEYTATLGIYDFGNLSMDTGAFTKLSTLQAMTTISRGSRVDAAHGVFYSLYSRGGVPPTHLLTLDIATGAKVRDVQVDKPLEDIELDAGGRILGFMLQAIPNEVVSVDADTGVTHHVADVPDTFDGWAPGASAIDRGAGIIYQLVGGLTPSSDGLLTVDFVRNRTAVIPLQVRFKTFTVCSACRAN